MKTGHTTYIFGLFSFFFCLLSSAPAQDLFNGEYILVQYIFDNQGGQGAQIYEVASEGQGSGTYRPLQSFGFEADSGSFIYDLKADRTFTIDDSGFVLQGMIDDQGEIFSMGDSRPEDGFFSVGIRKSSGRSVADMNGSYYVAEFHNGPSIQATAYDSIIFDGAGTATLYRISLSLSVDPDEEPPSFNYTVAENGMITINNDVIGAVSSNGEVFAAAATDSIGETSFALGIKISNGHSNTDLSDYFIFREFRLENDGEFITGQDSYGRLYFDGEGNGQVGMVDSEPVDEVFTYQLNPDGGFQVESTQSGLSGDGRFFVLVETFDSTSIAFGFGIKGEDPALAIQAAAQMVPSKPLLAQNFPNPFNPSTTLSYTLPRIAEINLSVFNLLGQKVSELVSGRQRAGRYTVTWQAGKFPSGIYFYVLRSGDGIVQTRKMMLVK